ncbi:MAG: RNA polymerase sigma factor [Spirochaetia bacterium]|jgi:RNA polymerase sigma-70 factor (ECF subfamily)|nr:RNA polymerase sigma factor [Spirochaetia bacterium]
MKISTDIPSFEKLYKTIFPIIYKVAYNIIGESNAAEDVCQEAFIKYYNLKYPLPSLDDAKYWMIRVVKNISFNYCKRESRKKKIFDKMKNDPVYSDITGEKEFLLGETKETVNSMLKQLPEKLKAPLVLREFAGLNYREISKVLGISESNVKVRIFRARETLQKLISPGDVYVP